MCKISKLISFIVNLKKLENFIIFKKKYTQISYMHVK
uniref:Uncharacterized protein n=1 Tax=viral metagenome TaxID=1070528 RepID=A0A6C0J883_9ZZZZ